MYSYLLWEQRYIFFLTQPNILFNMCTLLVDAVIKRLLDSGMTVEQVSEKSQYPIEYVKRFV